MSVPPSVLERIERHGIRFKSAHCALTVARFEPSVVVLRLVGHDVGAFGEGPLEAVVGHLAPGRPAEIFIDARDAQGASMDVGARWATLFKAHRSKIGGVNVLVRAKFIQLTAGLVRQFSELGDAMRIYTDEAAFDEALALAIG